MPNRRDVVKTAISVSALPLIGSQLAAAAGAPRIPWPRNALVDERSIASRAFGRGAVAYGLPVHTSRGDWSRLWATHLDREWRVNPTAVAGVTQHGPLFTFEQLARSRGMRPIFVAELRRRGNGAASLRVTGPAETVAQSTSTVDLDDEAWGARMAEIVFALPAADGAPPARAEVTNGLAPPVTEANVDTVYAWLIAPVARAARFV